MADDAIRRNPNPLPRPATSATPPPLLPMSTGPSPARRAAVAGTGGFRVADCR
jgi:hypothetical protein